MTSKTRFKNVLISIFVPFRTELKELTQGRRHWDRLRVTITKSQRGHLTFQYCGTCAWRSFLSSDSMQRYLLTSIKKTHCVGETIIRPSQVHNGVSYVGMTWRLYWIRIMSWGYIAHIYQECCDQRILSYELWSFLNKIFACEIYLWQIEQSFFSTKIGGMSTKMRYL